MPWGKKSSKRNVLNWDAVSGAIHAQHSYRGVQIAISSWELRVCNRIGGQNRKTSVMSRFTKMLGEPPFDSPPSGATKWHHMTQTEITSGSLTEPPSSLYPADFKQGKRRTGQKLLEIMTLKGYICHSLCTRGECVSHDVTCLQGGGEASPAL